MAKKSGPVDPLKAKEAKQKKIAIGGAVLLVLLLAVQVPKIMKQTSRSTAPPAQPTSTLAGAAPTPATTPAATTPATSFSATPAAGGSTISGLLSDPTPTAAIGQLSSFGTFVSKDPFAAQVPAPGSAAAAPAGGTKSGGTSTTAQPPAPPAPPTTTPAAVPTSAVISVNGVKAQVAVGSDFPVSQPFFHLVSATAHTVKISIAGGSLADGSGTLTLHEGKTVTLQNTTDGTRYTLELFPQGTPLTATATAPTDTATAPVATLPATTTAATTTGP